VNQFPDYRADKAVGKNNIVVRLGRRRAVNGYIILSLATYGVILLGVAMNILPQTVLLALVTAPLTVFSARDLRRKFNIPKELGPTCGRTVLVHFVTGLLLVVAYAIHIFVLDGRTIL
jgi:1,4-dihydroxy-2-naphthoate octaprenyltransferase